MEKAASSRTSLYHCLSLAEIVGFLILDSILASVTRLHKLSLRFLSYNSSRTTACGAGERKNSTTSDEAKEEQQLRREDVETVMESLGMPLVISSGSQKLNNFTSSTYTHELSTIFDGEEPSLEEVEAAFCVFDENCDGFIDPMELQRLLCKLGFTEGAELDACRQMIETYDENKDGKIDFDEFVRFMETSFC